MVDECDVWIMYVLSFKLQDIKKILWNVWNKTYLLIMAIFDAYILFLPRAVIFNDLDIGA